MQAQICIDIAPTTTLHNLAVKRAGDTQQQQGVPGWRGVEDDELSPGPAEQLAERLEHGDFLGAR